MRHGLNHSRSSTSQRPAGPTAGRIARSSTRKRAQVEQDDGQSHRAVVGPQNKGDCCDDGDQSAGGLAPSRGRDSVGQPFALLEHMPGEAKLVDLVRHYL